jgi:hypothetical protein
MDGACGTRGREENCIKDFGEETLKTENTWRN